MICTLRKIRNTKRDESPEFVVHIEYIYDTCDSVYGTVIIWVVGAQEVFKGNMTIGTIMALMNYQTIIMNLLLESHSLLTGILTAVVSLKGYQWFASVSGSETRRWREKVTTVNNISLEEMGFSYTESNKKVFDRLNLKFEKGTLYRSSWKKWTRQKHSVQEL